LLLPNGERDSDGNAEFSREKTFTEKLPVVEGAPLYKVVNARPIFSELRLIKSPYEIRLMQHAVDISSEAHMRSMAMAGRAEMEYQVQAEVEYTFRRQRRLLGLSSIVAAARMRRRFITKNRKAR
jgi:Xaa-Pro aminopeptidase